MAIKINPDILVGDTGNTINNSDILEWNHNPGSTNGSYIKFNNGLLICYKNISGVPSTNPELWAAGIYYTDISAGVWAYTFASVGNIQVTSSSNQWWVNVISSSETSCGTIRLMRPDPNNQRYSIQIFAIGRWK